MELYTKRNDWFLNPHCRPLMASFMSNMDIRLTIDVGKVIGYMTKYVTKPEALHSRRTRNFFFNALNNATEGGEATSVRTALNRLQTTVAGNRPRGKPETCHLINGLPLVYSSHTFTKVNLYNNTMEVEVGEGEVQTKVTLIDPYAKRNEASWWQDASVFVNARDNGLEHLNLDDFGRKYTLLKGGNFAGKIKELDRKKFHQYVPQLSNNPNGPKYVDYCQLGCVRYKTWRDGYHNAFGGSEVTDQEKKDIWNALLLEMSNNASSQDEEGRRPPDHLQQETMRALAAVQLSDNSLDVGGGGGGNGGAAQVDADDIDEDEFELQYSSLGTDVDLWHEDVDDNLVWDEEKDWGSVGRDLASCVSEDPVAVLQQRATNTNGPRELGGRTVNRNEMKDHQNAFVKLVETVLEYGDGDSSTDGGNEFSWCILLRGQGGTGKSFGMNYLRQKLEPGEVVALATTGKAATVNNGSTCFSRKDGLALPIGSRPLNPLQGRIKMDLQETHKNAKVVFIDEYSMLHQKYLQMINLRLQEIKANNKLFGGVVLVLVGDTAQLSPVKGKPLWYGGNDGCNASRNLYFQQFTSVIELVVKNRVDRNDEDAVWFENFLNKLADARIEENHYEWIRDRCSRDTMGTQAWRARGFDNPRITNLFPTNREVDTHNRDALKALNSPILRIDALNLSSRMKALSVDRCGGLYNVLFLAIGAEVPLTYNLCPKLGLANGSTGKVVGIKYRQKESPQTKKHLPYCVWVEMDDYSGESFFPEPTSSTEPSRSKWVPIYPQTHIEYTKRNGDWVEDTRTMIPLRLAWAWTIHKAQGQTIRNKIVPTLGNKEMEHGVSYVAFSWAVRVFNVGIKGGVTLCLQSFPPTLQPLPRTIIYFALVK
ncbi:unnamed protein product [Cylindrotheca closterium]|uniref:ATP-dependent DNA helicase n=1 Tax=Cylindrotheca closterium TaxID=2856 RepID=A0AAD2FK21_9STRA|nr:unnamed protein product [Cylindrotheca closterium]